METSKKDAESYEKHIIDRVNSNERIPQTNKEGMQLWLTFIKARGSAQGTINKHLFCFEKFLEYLPKGVEVGKATSEELQVAVGKIEVSDYAAETKNNMRVVIKAFYKHYIGEDLYYPKQVAWIKTTFKKKKVMPEDMLSETEILKMITIANNPRDKALIALLYDSGMRVGELISMRIKSVSLQGEVAHVTVDGKTGQRIIPVLFSAPYLSNYLGFLKDRKKDDYLWTAGGTWSNMKWELDESGVRKVLRTVAAKAGIEKRVYPHLFRHSRATYYANRITEQQLKFFFGWSGDSKMVSTYVHMSGRDIDNAILQVHGKKPKEEIAPKLVEKICPRCRFPNGIDFVHCKQCGAPLDPETLMTSDESRKVVEKFVLATASDPGLVPALQKVLDDSEKKKRGKNK